MAKKELFYPLERVISKIIAIFGVNMRYRFFILSVIIAFALSSATAFAQNKPDEKTQRMSSSSARKTVNKALSKREPKVTTQFGLGVVGKYTFLEALPVGEFPHSISTNFGIGASLQFRLNLGKFFAIQPEILYTFSKLKFQSTKEETYSPIKVNESLVQMPLLLSFRAGIVYFNFGPVFRLVDNCYYTLTNATDNSVEQRTIGEITPAVTYAAGVSVKMPKNMMIDLRYTGQFADIKTPNEFIWTLDEAKQPTADQFRTRNSTVQLRFGFLF